MRWGWSLYLFVVGVATATYFFLPESLQSNWYNGIGVAAAVAMIAGTRWHRPEPEVAWLLLGFGVLSLAIGNIVFGSGQDVPSPADMFYVSAYPVLALALLGMRSWTGIRRTGRTLGTAVAIAGVVGAITWAFLILPAGRADKVTLATKIVAIGYPAMDVVLILLLIRAMGSFRSSPTALKLLGAGLVLMFAADLAYALQNFGDSYSLGSSLDALWLLSYAFFGAALLHPSVREDVLVWDEAPVQGHGGVAMLQRTELVRESLGQDLRFGVVVKWAGRLLVALGFVTVCAAGKMFSVEIAILGGAYATTGVMMWLAGARLAYA